nr:hypothetical protein [Clostridium intestinale]
MNVELQVEYKESQNKDAYNIQAVDYVANAIYSFYEYGYKTYYGYLSEKIEHEELFPRAKFRKVKTEIAATKEL